MSVDAAEVLEAAKAKGVMIATAESCTGGLIAAALTEVAGSSAVVDRGFVTYSNEAKAAMLGVAPDLILKHGAVSAQVATAMVHGALTHSKAGLAVAVTGIAGPGGGSDTKPVGLVYVAAGRSFYDVEVQEYRFAKEDITERSAIRNRTVEVALEMLLAQLAASD